MRIFRLEMALNINGICFIFKERYCFRKYPPSQNFSVESLYLQKFIENFIVFSIANISNILIQNGVLVQQLVVWAKDMNPILYVSNCCTNEYQRICQQYCYFMQLIWINVWLIILTIFLMRILHNSPRQNNPETAAFDFRHDSRYTTPFHTFLTVLN